MATHSSILAWRIPWTEEPGGLQFIGGSKESDTTERQSTAQHNPFILSNYGREQGIVNKVNTVKQSHTAVPSFLSRILLVMHLISFPHFGLGGDFRHLSLFLVLW